MDITRPSVQVGQMNEAFGNERGNPGEVNWEAVDRQMAIIESEFNELKEGVMTRTLHGAKGIRDGVADVQVTAIGMAHIIGFDSDKDMLEVYNSNMSKLCVTQEELVATQKKYADIGVVTYVGGELPRAFVKSALDQTGSNGEFYKKGKFLKGINFKEPNLTEETL